MARRRKSSSSCVVVKRRRIRHCRRRKRGPSGMMKCAIFSHPKVKCMQRKRTKRGKRCVKYARRK